MAMKIEMIQRLDLGIQGEHNVRPIRIDCTSWLDQYPNGSVDLMHKRHGDEVPGLTGASFNRESKILTWTPTDYDTFYDGDGYAEIRLTEGTNVKMKKKALTLVHPCIVNDVGDELESGWQGFLDEVTLQKSKMGSQSEAWAVGQRNGVDVDEDDETYHNNSKYFAQNMADVKDQYVAEIEAAGEAAQALIPEDLDYYAPAADVEEIKGHFSNGVLKVTSGGTGATTIPAARNALGLGNTDGPVPIQNGGTGATTVAGARNALGLGNTNGALPVANGGTGNTTAKDAMNSFINALEIGNSDPVDDDYYVAQYAGGGTTVTSYTRRPVSKLWNYIKSKFMPNGYVPVDKGGTGATTAAGALTAIGGKINVSVAAFYFGSLASNRTDEIVVDYSNAILIAIAFKSTGNHCSGATVVTAGTLANTSSSEPISIYSRNGYVDVYTKANKSGINMWASTEMTGVTVDVYFVTQG